MTENTFNKMIKTSDDFLRAYPSPNAYLWDQNFVNGQYVIAYVFDYGLDQNVKSMLPKVIILVHGRNKIGDLQGVIENLPVSCERGCPNYRTLKCSASYRWSFDPKFFDINDVNDN